MKISTSKSTLTDQKKDALLIFFEGKTVLLPKAEHLTAEWVRTLIENTSFKGEVGQVAVLPLPSKPGTFAKQLIVAGIGEARYFHNGHLEQAAAAAVRAGRNAGAKSFAVSAESPLKDLSESDYQLLVGRGAAWGTYAFTQFKSANKLAGNATLTFVGNIKDRSAINAAEAQGAALLSTADLANLPGNEAPPQKIADWAEKMAQKVGLNCQILNAKELQKKGCGALLSVAKGSAQDARLIILKHAGKNPKDKPIVLAGKTVTFDSGGISLKPGKGMGWMRYDKCGGMAVLAAMQMIARMKVDTPVVGILGAVENMPGANATRPGDIVKAYNGKTIEILNTDAEGRLVLADALGIAADMKPRAIVDLATLTGAVIVALGSAASAVLGNNDELVQALIESATTAGERLWRLPLYKEYTDEMKSDFADLSNLCKSGGAGTATAAAFLQEFVPDDIPWAHLDIAGTAWLESAKPHQDAGATLFGARLLTQWIANQ
ncbi:MAG: leucyl aminopeptidase [Pontiellaceae bacterium]|nr:leucyl aminopeptidase [Pontiellaceae bacterium]